MDPMNGWFDAGVPQGAGPRVGKYFTLEEARAVLLLLSPVTCRIKELTQSLVKKQNQYSFLQQRMRRERGSVQIWELSEVRDWMQGAEYELQRHLEQILRTGAHVKGLNPLLLDFPAVADQRVINLCWKEGEGTISHWHEAHLGFRDRRPLESSH